MPPIKSHNGSSSNQEKYQYQAYRNLRNSGTDTKPTITPKTAAIIKNDFIYDKKKAQKNQVNSGNIHTFTCSCENFLNAISLKRAIGGGGTQPCSNQK